MWRISLPPCNMIKKYALFFLLTAFAVLAKAQDAEFSQFYANPLYLNPAMAGSTKCPRVNLNYRNQWPALPGTFITTSASFDQYVDLVQGGLGFMILNDKAGQGIINNTSINGFYAYQFNISREVAAKIGFQGTYVQKSTDFTGLILGDQIETRVGVVKATGETFADNVKGYADFSTGVMVYSSAFYMGAAFNHLTQPNESFYNKTSPLPLKITVHGGAVIPLGRDKKFTNTYISPGFMFQTQGVFNQLNLGMYVGKGVLVFGTWYRTSVAKGESFLGSDSFILLLGVQQGIFKFGYSYDVTVNQLYNASAGSHELSLGMQFECRPKKKKFRAIKCPSF